MDFVQFDPAIAVTHWGLYRPGASALISNGAKVSYASLDAATAEIAAGLGKFADGERIAVLSASKADLLKFVLGVARSGHAVVVLNPTLPPDALVTNLRTQVPTPYSTQSTMPPNTSKRCCWRIRIEERRTTFGRWRLLHMGDPFLVREHWDSEGDRKGPLLNCRGDSRLVYRAGPEP